MYNPQTWKKTGRVHISIKGALVNADVGTVRISYSFCWSHLSATLGTNNTIFTGNAFLCMLYRTTNFS